MAQGCDNWHVAPTCFAHRPGPEKGSSAIDRTWIPVQEYFDSVAKKFQDGRWFAHKIEQ
jgi:hypothetical protein